MTLKSTKGLSETVYRVITDHLTTEKDSHPLGIHVMDKPGLGGASHYYRIRNFHVGTNPSTPYYYDSVDESWLEILFQNGTLQEKGPNGVTMESLLAVCIDRLRSFQDGSFACRENDKALQHLEEAMHWLHERTRKRVLRGVEGKLVE